MSWEKEADRLTLEYPDKDELYKALKAAVSRDHKKTSTELL